MNNIELKLPESWKILAIWFILLILGFSVYVNALNGYFVWDDEILVQRNMAIRGLSGIPNLFTQDMSGNRQDVYSYGFYRPLVMAVYAIGYSFSGLDVQVYHFINILMHILTTLSICFLVYLLFGNYLTALLCGLLFLIHPVHVEAVTYISGLADPLSAFFILWSFIFYIEYLKSGRKLLYIFLLISYILALFSKENSLIFPVILLLYHWAFKVKYKIKQFFPILLLVLLYLFFRANFLKSTLPHTDIMQWMHLLKRIPGFLAAIINYLRILFLPFDLHMEYGNKLFHFLDLRVIIGTMFSIGLLVYAFLKRNKNALFFFSVFWFFITLLPCSSIYPINAFYMAEHWLYLPSIGFFIIISKGLTDLYEHKKLKPLGIILILALSTAYSYLTIKQNNYWEDPLNFYKTTLRYAPRSARIYNNLGRLYYYSGKYNQAAEMYKDAIKFGPKESHIYNNLGLVYESLNNPKEAIEAFKKAIEMNPEYSLAYNNLGAYYERLGRYNETIYMCKKAVEIDPSYSQAYYNLALAYFRIRQYQLAIEYCDKALKLNYKPAQGLAEVLKPYRDKK
jgi:Tfp pilus assembly protein PilF